MIKNVKFHIEKIDEVSSNTPPENPKREDTETRTNQEALAALRNMISRQANAHRRLSLQD